MYFRLLHNNFVCFKVRNCFIQSVLEVALAKLYSRSKRKLPYVEPK